jgi:hypothetical protein
MSHVPEWHLPDGHLPSGHLPDGSGEAPYPDVSLSRSIRLPAGGVWVVDPDVVSWCEIVWDAALPDGVTLVSVSYTLPNGLTEQDTSIETALGKSAIQVSGAAHGSTSQVAAVATLSNAQTMACTAPLRCFNG